MPLSAALAHRLQSGDSQVLWCGLNDASDGFPCMFRLGVRADLNGDSRELAVGILDRPGLLLPVRIGPADNAFDVDRRGSLTECDAMTLTPGEMTVIVDLNRQTQNAEIEDPPLGRSREDVTPAWNRDARLSAAVYSTRM